MLQGRYRRLISQMESLKWEIKHKKLNEVQILQLDEFQSVIFLCSGPLDSPYEGYWFRVKIQWPSDYPFRPPTCTFLDKVWNPYVDFESGKICMDILADNFSPALTTINIILSLISLLSEYKISENSGGFLNPTAGIELLKNRPYFNEHARQMCEKHSYKKKEIYTDNMRGMVQESIVEIESNQIPQFISENIESQKFKKKPPVVNLQIEDKIQQLQQLQLYANQEQLQDDNNFLDLMDGSKVPIQIKHQVFSDVFQLNHPEQVSQQNNTRLNLKQMYIKKRKLIKKQKEIQPVLSDDQFKEQVEKHRQKIRFNLQNFGSIHSPKDGLSQI